MVYNILKIWGNFVDGVKIHGVKLHHGILHRQFKIRGNFVKNENES